VTAKQASKAAKLTGGGLVPGTDENVPGQAVCAADVQSRTGKTLPLRMRAMPEYAAKGARTIAIQINEVVPAERELRKKLLLAARRREIDVCRGAQSRDWSPPRYISRSSVRWIPEIPASDRSVLIRNQERLCHQNPSRTSIPCSGT
jgi:hypothetical protein